MSAGKLNETAMYMKKVYTESTNMTSRMARARNGTSTKVRDWSLITGRGGGWLQNGKIAGFASPPQKG